MIRLGILAITLAFIAAPVLAQKAASIANATPGTLVELTGTVERMSDDEFVLVDQSGSIPVYIGPHPMAVRSSEKVTVIGRIDDDFPREVYAEQLRLADGTVRTVGGPYQ